VVVSHAVRTYYAYLFVHGRTGECAVERVLLEVGPICELDCDGRTAIERCVVLREQITVNNVTKLSRQSLVDFLA